jgi:hypothetical protein
MIIFTPNTVIQSSQINGNFEELTNKFAGMDTLYKRIDNGTGSRSTTTSAVMADMPGSSFDYTPTIDCTLYLFMTILTTSASAGVTRWTIKVGASQAPQSSYIHLGLGWNAPTIDWSIDLTANTTYTIVGRWIQEGGGTGTVCNANTDGSFPGSIRGFTIPR